MNRTQRPKQNPSSSSSYSYADYSGYEKSLPVRLKAREKYRHDHEQNAQHNLHGRENSYRAQAEFDHQFTRDNTNSWESPNSGGELSYEEQYRTDGELHNYRGPLEDDRYGEYPRYGKNLDRSARAHRNFSGVGPKGYKRSDERIEEDVCEALARDQYIDASEIVVAVKDGLVMLSGSVDNREDRFEAEMLVENILGVEDIENNIRVMKQNSPHEYLYRESNKAQRRPSERSH